MRALIEWLYRRYPPRLTVSVQDYNELRAEVAQYNVAIQALQQLNVRLEAVERQVKQMADYSGVVTQGKASFRLER